jgi:hypothetical protein
MERKNIMKSSSTILVILLVCTFVLGIQKPDKLFAQYRSPDWTASDINCTSYSEIITAGDINGDGFDDIAINVYEWYFILGGGIFVYYGSLNGPASAPGMDHLGRRTLDHFIGTSMTCKGDVNNDGYADLIAEEFG